VLELTREARTAGTLWFTVRSIALLGRPTTISLNDMHDKEPAKDRRAPEQQTHNDAASSIGVGLFAPEVPAVLDDEEANPLHQNLKDKLDHNSPDEAEERFG
jgi:hypothetical protein